MTEDYHWNDVALGFLLARGIHYKHVDKWDLLSSFTCGDRPRALAALARRKD